MATWRIGIDYVLEGDPFQHDEKGNARFDIRNETARYIVANGNDRGEAIQKALSEYRAEMGVRGMCFSAKRLRNSYTAEQIANFK